MNSYNRSLRPALCFAAAFWSLGVPGLPAWADQADPDTQPATSSAPATAPTTAPAGTQPAADAKPKKPKTVPLAFKNAPIDQIAKFLAEQLDKPVLPDEGVKKVKVTVVNPKPLPPAEALFVLRTALHEHGVAIEERERTVHLVPIDQIIRRGIETVPAGVDIATITPVNKPVRKVFQLQYYDPTKLVDTLKTLLPSWGHIVADDTTKKLIVIGTVERLITVARVIQELDESDVSGGEHRRFYIKHADVYELISTLRQLIAAYLGVETKAIVVSGVAGAEKKKSAPPDRRPRGPSGRDQPSKTEAAQVGAISIKAEKSSVLLIPEPRSEPGQSALVVVAPSHVMDQIELWLETLDTVKLPSKQWEIVEVKYGDAGELAQQLTDMLTQMPDESLRSGLWIHPFGSARRLLVVGSEQNRQIVKDWLEQIDVADAGKLVQETFTLKYADAGQVASNIEELFGDTDTGYRGYYSYYRRSPSRQDKVTVTANVRRNAVTVQATPVQMERIRKQIEEWDCPLKGDEAAPLIISLKYADPAKTKDLLESLFTKRETQFSWRDYYYGEMDEAPSPVGRLFGQFRFEAYPDTGKLIVVSKNEENYEVINKMIAEIDKPPEAGLPRTIQLKFADAETVAEQLNALLNAPGTQTSILRRGRLEGFERFSDDRSPYSQARQTEARPTQQQGQDQSQTVMRFWWQEVPPHPDIDARQPSNLVGKLRIVPNIERNLLLVAVPEEYSEAVDQLVAELDKPGYQVLIKAVVAEASLDDSMSLGFRFSTDPTLFTSGESLITENALRGLFRYEFEDMHQGEHTFTLDMDVNNLISLLGRVTDIKIKSEPKILTGDNVEAEFFDGRDIPFLSNSTLLDTGRRDDTFDYVSVGLTMRVRPHITEDKSINLLVQLRVSSVVPGETLFNAAIVDRRETTTQITLQHGKTFMISGILREEEHEIVRRVPGLGDIPVLGELFKHRETAKVNTELLVFLTPYVIGPYPAPPESDPIEKEPAQQLERLWPENIISDAQGPPRESIDPVRSSDSEETKPVSGNEEAG